MFEFISAFCFHFAPNIDSGTCTYPVMSMYSEWLSAKDIPSGINLEHVLQTYPNSVGQTVVNCVVKSIVDTPLSLTTHEELSWTMQVLGHGLTLPLHDYIIIQHCVDIYSDWLHAAVSRRIDKKPVPAPLMETPEHYIGVIFMQYFSSLFEEKGAVGNLLYHQTNLCQSVLEITHVTLKEVKLTTQTWTTIMKSLLRVADSLLSPPTEPKSLGDQLSNKLVHVTFNLWIRMASTAFPPPSLWKALCESCVLWRHHPEVVKEWSYIMISLTKMVIRLLYGPDNCTSIRDPKSAYAESVKRLSSDALVQCWFRMLHTIGNPVELSYPLVLERSTAFQHHRSQNPSKGPSSHPCLENLKDIFHEAMLCVSNLVDMFLSVNPVYQEKPKPPVRESSSQQNSPMIGLKFLATPSQDLGKSLPVHMLTSAGRTKSPLHKTPSNPGTVNPTVPTASLSSSFGDIPKMTGSAHRLPNLSASDPDRTDGLNVDLPPKPNLPTRPKGEGRCVICYTCPSYSIVISLHIPICDALVYLCLLCGALVYVCYVLHWCMSVMWCTGVCLLCGALVYVCYICGALVYVCYVVHWCTYVCYVVYWCMSVM